MNRPHPMGTVPNASAYRDPRLWFIAVPVMLPLLVFAWLNANPEYDLRVAVPVPHFYIVILATLLAVLLAGGVLRAALSIRHTPTLLLGLAFLSAAVFTLLHGLSTPGVFRGGNQFTGISAWLSVLAPGILLALSTHCEDYRWAGWVAAHMKPVIAAFLAATVVYGTVGIALTPPANSAVPAVSSYGATASTDAPQRD